MNECRDQIPDESDLDFLTENLTNQPSLSPAKA